MHALTCTIATLLPPLTQASTARVRKILDDFACDDSALNALSNCVSKNYEDLNATIFGRMAD
jgi:hypothetical protein